MNPPGDSAQEGARWLLLIHQLPTKPAYLRVKIWRRLQGIGAIAVKNAVYALPASADAQEDFAWLVKEIVAGGGEAMVCDARLVDGLSDEEVRALFNAARDADYEAIVTEARRLAEPNGDEAASDARNQVARLRKRLEAVAAIDFFGANGREPAEGMLSSLESRTTPRDDVARQPLSANAFQKRIWVTRQGVHVDRIACAWVIRRFIDPAAVIKFVPGKGYRPGPGELRFDMFEGEITHEADRCSMEVLLARAGLEGDPALQAIAEIVHDIDLKDGKFGREEAVGIARLIAGIAMGSADDDERVTRGGAVFDDLYQYFRRKRG